uniref:Uncharacterized protein n=1 Tax=Megaselia scalaris TaxID=36166 RepID=T1GTQ0_MEGSC
MQLIEDQMYTKFGLGLNKYTIHKELDKDLKKKKLVTQPCALSSILSFGTFAFAFNTNLCYCIRPLVTMAIQEATGKNITMIMPFSV